KAYLTPSGVPVVDLNTANGAGLSHNKFTHYNVPTQGLVLNNSVPTQFSYPSQLVGSVTVNFNTKDAAKVILNEVVAPNATTIAGFTEIVGGKADLVVANPYGIAVKGGGFINTDRVTLATGEPMIGPDGTLAGLRVVRGELSIAGNGLNATNVSLIDLLARTVKIDGQVNAQELIVGAGANDYDYASRQLSANHAPDAAPAYAVDSSVLGGMYANRIRLVATDAGVGVRMLGDDAAPATSTQPAACNSRTNFPPNATSASPAPAALKSQAPHRRSARNAISRSTPKRAIFPSATVLSSPAAI
ncbi:MAG TPA: filamentous hemagglutinin N-terminal domain-containing protein, partial [Opitutus sp.]|nr:filamentous hemagglutinin N-terminal domain-containing protein [Opitutus sp.]